MFAIKITADKLEELRMLMDWQVREMGFDPDSVTAACLEKDLADEHARFSRFRENAPS